MYKLKEIDNGRLLKVSLRKVYPRYQLRVILSDMSKLINLFFFLEDILDF